MRGLPIARRTNSQTRLGGRCAANENFAPPISGTKERVIIRDRPKPHKERRHEQQLRLNFLETPAIYRLLAHLAELLREKRLLQQGMNVPVQQVAVPGGKPAPSIFYFCVIC